MKIGNWFNVELEQVEGIGDLEAKLQEAKKEGIANPKDEILTGIAELKIDYKKDLINIKTVPALFPLNKKLQERFGNKYLHTLLSTLTHEYATKDATKLDNPEYVLIQKRSRKATSQGHSEIQPAAAGFVAFGEQPHVTASREFKEETGISKNYSFVEYGENGLCVAESKPKCLDLTIHNLAYKGMKNPLLSYVIKTDESAVENKRIVKTLKDIDSHYDAGVDEVAEVVRVPWGNIQDFYNEVLSANREFGSTFQSLLSFIDIFKK